MSLASLRSDAIVAIAAAVVLGACHRHASTDAPVAGVVERIVHGTVSITGTSFEQHLVLDTGNGSIRLHPASAADSSALTHLGGVEVSVHGTDEPGALRVRSFTAQRVSGKPVVDGYVRADGSRLYLETTTGRVDLGNPPAALRNMVGARVWIDGNPANGPNAYGVIVAPRP